MPPGRRLILQVALPVPLRRCFDYLLGDQPRGQLPLPGMRVQVPFGKSSSRTGLITAVTDHSAIDTGKLKAITGIIDHEPLFSRAHLELLIWASDYYHHPVGEVLLSTLPSLLRRGRPAVNKKTAYWRLTDSGRAVTPESLRCAPRQRQILAQLGEYSHGIPRHEIRGVNTAGILKRLREKGLIEQFEPNNALHACASDTGITLNRDQARAVDAVCARLDDYRGVLLQGVTGSGKTEVYIEIIKRLLAQQKQALVLVPEIGLTPQLISRFQARIGARIAVLHSGLSDSERLQAWMDARSGSVPLVLGTRSAVWTPLRNAGVIILDEEHDQSYKQQDGFRYSARDVAIMRSKKAGIPVILGSATPSMETLQNVHSGKFICLPLSRRAADTTAPQISIIDMRGSRGKAALSTGLLHAIEEELGRRRQVLLFLNRRGYAPAMMCHGCGWVAKCRRCEIHLTYHKHSGRLDCHHCGASLRPPAVCPECGGSEILHIGHGTERLEETLAALFPDARILRIDRDSTRRKGALQEMFSCITSGAADIMVGTQMIAKGHHFPDLDLVGIIDADRGLFSSDFRASEQMAQLIVQVSGRAGRESNRGRVYIQTHHPEHPLLQSLIRRGYNDFCRELLQERELANLPPFSYLALLRAEDYQAERAMKFLNEARKLLARANPGVEIYGPVPAPMELKAGRKRFQLLLQSGSRQQLQKQMRPWSLQLESIAGGREVRWSLDIDPVDMM